LKFKLLFVGQRRRAPTYPSQPLSSPQGSGGAPQGKGKGKKATNTKKKPMPEVEVGKFIVIMSWYGYILNLCSDSTSK
jgi:hypothetical protein